MKLIQYIVSWDDKERLVHAVDADDARYRVQAPRDAEVRESHLMRKDIEKLLLEGK